MSVLHGWLVRNTAKFPNPQRVLELVEAGLVQFPSLQVTLVPDGTSDSAMCINGTLPVVFHGNTFNIPVEFSLPPMFPEHSPMAYVRPTAAMMIRGGKHVDGSGRVFHPYLASWSWGSTLGELFECLIAAFSLEPPVFSRPPRYPGAAARPAGVSPQPHSAATIAPRPPPPPQMAAATSLSTPDVRQRPLAYMETGVPAVSASAEVSTPAFAAVSSAEQDLARLTVQPSTVASAGPADSAAPAGAVPSPRQQQVPAHVFNAVHGRPPVPALGAAHAQGRRFSAETNERPSHTGQSDGAQTRASEDDPTRAGGSAEAQPAAEHEKLAREDRHPPLLRVADSAATIEPATGTAAEVAPATAAATITPTTAADDISAEAHTENGSKSPVASSLLDEEPMDDPQKRHLGYQLAIYDRVMEAVNRSREKHTRVNKELLDQSANLNSGAGVIAEERQQLLESQRQLSANIGVLEHKLNELNEKKAEFPDAAAIADVCKVFCGQTPAMDQLFDLAGEIAAIDDALYFLGRALNDGRLPLGMYMRQVRKLAQQQFMAKALAIKIRGLCSLD